LLLVAGMRTLVALALLGCSAPTPTSEPDAGATPPPPGDTGATWVHDPGLEGAPFSLDDPACSDQNGSILCRAVVYSVVDGVSLHLDIHAPSIARTQRVPTIIYLHPGGWSVGNYAQTVQLAVADDLARGYAVLAVEYRLTLNPDKTVSGVTFPENLKDAKTAVRWARIKGASFIDPDRLLAYGPSAGAHLASLLAVTPGVAAFDGRGDPSVPTSVKAFVGISTPIDFHLFVPMNPPLDPSCAPQPPGQNPQQAISLLIGGDLDDPQYDSVLDQLSLLTYLDASSPPIQLTAGTCDQTVPYHGAEETATYAQDHGLSQVHVSISPGKFHGTTLDDPQTKAAVDAFIAAQLD
jgi:acetyl esterase/lipase